MRLRCAARHCAGPDGRTSQTSRLTLASVAPKVRCAGCFTGPDEVHLAATMQGLERLHSVGCDLVTPAAGSGAEAEAFRGAPSGNDPGTLGGGSFNDLLTDGPQS